MWSLTRSTLGCTQWLASIDHRPHVSNAAGKMGMLVDFQCRTSYNALPARFAILLSAAASSSLSLGREAGRGMQSKIVPRHLIVVLLSATIGLASTGGSAHAWPLSGALGIGAAYSWHHTVSSELRD